MKNKLHYRIADHSVEVYSYFQDKLSKLLPGFESFDVDSDNTEPLIQLYRDFEFDTYEEVNRRKGQIIIHRFDMEKDYCTFSKMGSKYYFTIEDCDGDSIIEFEMEIGSPRVRCRMKPDFKDRQIFMPNQNQLQLSLWMALSFAGIPKKFSAVISSVVVYNNKAIMFLGESGTGKNAHTKLWCSHIPESKLLNDVSPILSIDGDTPYIYGSPWNGKGRRSVNERYPLAAVVRLRTHYRNQIEQMNKLESFGALYSAFPQSYLKDEYFEEHICSIISTVISTTPVYLLHCLPDKEAVEMVMDTLKP